MEILVWVIMIYGLTTIVVYGSIFEELRCILERWGQSKTTPFNFLGKFLSNVTSCPLCFSTWAGFFFGLTMFSPTYSVLGVNQGVSWVFDGLFSAGAVWIVNSIVEFFEENRINKN